jgi:hypothetical protein
MDLEITEFCEVTAFGSITSKISEISVIPFFESLTTAEYEGTPRSMNSLQ